MAFSIDSCRMCVRRALLARAKDAMAQIHLLYGFTAYITQIRVPQQHQVLGLGGQVGLLERLGLYGNFVAH